MLIDRAGDLPDGWVDEQLLDARCLADVPSWISGICKVGTNMRLGADKLSVVMKKLSPSAQLTYSPDGLRRLARTNMQRQLESETKVLQSLDLNHRVLVTGGSRQWQDDAGSSMGSPCSRAWRTCPLHLLQRPTCRRDPSEDGK